MTVDLQKRKEIIFNNLNELESDCRILLQRINSARADLQDVETIEDGKLFDEKYDDFEKDLQHIRLF